jgi:4-diphosphocytidyl-2-C-methyl-D-erythritol kinase
MTPRGGTRSFLGLPAPAKLNLFLHVVGRRADGYHDLQSAFVPIDLADLIDVSWRGDGAIVRHGDIAWPHEQDLAVRAAQLLQAQAGEPARRLGATITIEKRIPAGAGLGGGSSDAATTLLALNRLWNLGLPRAELAQIGARLGADVSFFFGAGPAFVEGIGERASPLPIAPGWVVLVFPQVPVSTAEIFNDPKLTRDTKRTTISGFSAALAAVERGRELAWTAAYGTNDLEAVARQSCTALDEALALVGQFAPVRMTGSGSAVFSVCADEAQARHLQAQLRQRVPVGWSVWAVATLEELPLADW